MLPNSACGAIWAHLTIAKPALRCSSATGYVPTMLAEVRLRREQQRYVAPTYSTAFPKPMRLRGTYLKLVTAMLGGAHGSEAMFIVISHSICGICIARRCIDMSSSGRAEQITCHGVRLHSG